MSPSVRHPVVLSLWAALFVLAGLGLTNAEWFIAVFIASPIVAIVSAYAVYARKDPELLRPGWSIAYRATSVLLALASFTGIVAMTGRLVGHAHWFENAPLALLFLFAFLCAWPSVTKPSPQSAATPALVIHVVWLPLIIVQAVTHFHQESNVPFMVGIVSLCAILALSAVLAVLSVVAFSGETRIAPATARM